MILWKRSISAAAVAEPRARGQGILDDLFSPIAPLGWEHIRFNGDDVWPTEPLKDGFRSLRNPRSPSSKHHNRLEGMISSWNVLETLVGEKA